MDLRIAFPVRLPRRSDIDRPLSKLFFRPVRVTKRTDGLARLPIPSCLGFGTSSAGLIRLDPGGCLLY